MSPASASFISPDALLSHWQGHRRLTRRVIDAFPDDKFIGRVARIGSAATSRFALLPTPNPSGNFTKITQRVPVKIDFTEMPRQLSPGMMVEVDIDIR